MPDNIEYLLGSIDSRLSGIDANIIKIEGHLEKQNDRIDNVEKENVAIKKDTEKNCKSITGLWKRVNASKLSMRDKIMLWGVIITGVFSIVVAMIMRFT